MRGNLARATTHPHDILDIGAQITLACTEAKGRDVLVLSTSEISDLFSYFIIVSGRSDRQVQGIGNKILERTSKCGINPLAVDGMEIGHWVVMDYGDILVHIFYEPLRSHYDLEGLWAKAKKVDFQLKQGKPGNDAA